MSTILYGTQMSSGLEIARSWIDRFVITDDSGTRLLDPDADLAICLHLLLRNTSPLRGVVMMERQARALSENLVIICCDYEEALETQRTVGGDGFQPHLSGVELLRCLCGVHVIPDDPAFVS